MDKIPLEVQGEESAIRFRDCFSVRYLQSAALLCRLAFAIEQEYREAGESRQISSSGTRPSPSTRFSPAVSFLESTVNELHADATDEEYSAIDEKHEDTPKDDREAVAQCQKFRPGADADQVPDDPRHCRPARI